MSLMDRLPKWLLLAISLRSLLWLATRIQANRTSSIRRLRGPARNDWRLGVLDVAGHMDAWRAQYGPTFRYPGVFFVRTHRLHTSDFTDIRHMLSNPDVYQRPMQNGPLGRGLLSTEGEEHRNLRKIVVHSSMSGRQTRSGLSLNSPAIPPFKRNSALLSSPSCSCKPSGLLATWEARMGVYGDAVCRPRDESPVFILFRAFLFELAQSEEDVACVEGFLGQPYVRSRLELGTQLPLKLTTF
ncbi:hypothetical protein C8F01DRAFT_1369291 [Mycena amicta]|nr:hypothetical protein C8F01DRAFT_1369291 [Mycena amicta]